jgi:hypothetical protein
VKSPGVHEFIIIQFLLFPSALMKKLCNAGGLQLLPQCSDSRHARSSLRQIKHLPWIQQPVKLVKEFGALIAATLRVDEHQQRLRVWRRNWLYDENLVDAVMRSLMVVVVVNVISGSAFAAARSASAAHAATAVSFLE